jgi:hypothetical protein
LRVFPDSGKRRRFRSFAHRNLKRLAKALSGRIALILQEKMRFWRGTQSGGKHSRNNLPLHILVNARNYPGLCS